MLTFFVASIIHTEREKNKTAGINNSGRIKGRTNSKKGGMIYIVDIVNSPLLYLIYNSFCRYRVACKLGRHNKENRNLSWHHPLC